MLTSAAKSLLEQVRCRLGARRRVAVWLRGGRRFASVRLESLYEGIDLEIGEREEHLEYDLYLEGGADLSKVVVSVHGATVRLPHSIS